MLFSSYSISQQQQQQCSELRTIHTGRRNVRTFSSQKGIHHSRRKKKALNVAMVGSPNAGKSSLVNRFVDEKVSAVSPKVNTTRSTIHGVRTLDETQLVFVDLPGFVERTVGRKGLYVQPLRNMVETALSTEELEAIMLVVDATTKPNRFEWNMFQRIVDALNSSDDEKERPPCFLVLNKTDLLPSCRLVRAEGDENRLTVQSRLRGKKNKLRFKDRISLQIFDTLVQELQENANKSLGGFQGIHTVSALKRWGLEDLENDMIRCARTRPWEYDRNEVTSLSIEERVTEIVRSHMFRRLNREVPYTSSIHFIEMYESEGCYVIRHQIRVKTKSHYRIARGATSYIERATTQDLQAILKRPVEFYLGVKQE